MRPNGMQEHVQQSIGCKIRVINRVWAHTMHCTSVQPPTQWQLTGQGGRRKVLPSLLALTCP